MTPARVLIVDDHPDKLVALAAVLAGMDVEVTTAGSGAEALRQLLDRDFAVVLLDVNMPIMDGFETARMIRQRARTAHLPIIFITAEQYADSARLKGYGMGAVDYITGAIIPEILRAKVAVFADLYRLREQGVSDQEELQRKNEQIERQNLMLQHANRLKDEFLAGTSHELRTPLNSIIGFSELLKSGMAGPVSPTQRQYASVIFDSGQHLLALINDILDLSRLEAIMVRLEPSEVKLPELLQNSLSLVKGRAFKHRISLALEIAPDVDRICADERRLKQILYNLLSNAVKFTLDGGHVTLSARRARRMRDGKSEEGLEFAVTDTGIGIAAEDMDKLFQPFVQIDADLSRRYEGTGLGLVMVKRLAELHGGGVEVQSELGKGSCFRVWLPLAPLGSPAAATRSSGRGRRALVIEGGDLAATLLCGRLAGLGYGCERASAAAAGMDSVGACVPDLIVLDLLLPDLGGWEFLSRFRSDAQFDRIPLLLLCVAQNATNGWLLGAGAVVQKPLTSRQLELALRSVNLLPGRGTKQPSVLVADSDPASLQALSEQLRDLKCTPLSARDGAEAIDMARSGHPDSILLDLGLAGISAFEVAEALRQESATAQPPIIALAARDAPADVLERLNERLTKAMLEREFKPDAFAAAVGSLNPAEA